MRDRSPSTSSLCLLIALLLLVHWSIALLGSMYPCTLPIDTVCWLCLVRWSRVLWAKCASAIGVLTRHVGCACYIGIVEPNVPLRLACSHHVLVVLLRLRSLVLSSPRSLRSWSTNRALGSCLPQCPFVILSPLCLCVWPVDAVCWLGLVHWSCVL